LFVKANFVGTKPFLPQDEKKGVVGTWASEYDQWKTSDGETITGEVER
jgi:hypothetical protein